MKDETTVETTLDGEAILGAEGVLMIPTAGLPAGTVIQITITVGGEEKPAQAEQQPSRKTYMGQRTINGGAQ